MCKGDCNFKGTNTPSNYSTASEEWRVSFHFHFRHSWIYHLPKFFYLIPHHGNYSVYYIYRVVIPFSRFTELVSILALSPRPDEKYKQRGRAWYWFAHVVTRLCSHVTGWLERLWYLLLKNWAATSLVRLQHGLNSSNGEVPSVEVRLYLFTLTMVHLKNIAMQLWRMTLLS